MWGTFWAFLWFLCSGTTEFYQKDTFSASFLDKNKCQVLVWNVKKVRVSTSVKILLSLLKWTECIILFKSNPGGKMPFKSPLLFGYIQTCILENKMTTWEQTSPSTRASQKFSELPASLRLQSDWSVALLLAVSVHSFSLIRASSYKGN